MSLTDIHQERPMTTDLGEFDGHDILRTTIAVTNAGDGLSEALGVDPRLMHHGETVYVVLECEVTKIRFDPIKDTSALTRVHTLRAGTATIVDADLVIEQLEAQAQRIRDAREHEAGVQRILDKSEFQLAQEHADGEHDNTDGVPGCPVCADVYGEPDPGLVAVPDTPEPIS